MAAHQPPSWLDDAVPPPQILGVSPVDHWDYDYVNDPLISERIRVADSVR